jgi:hypothetical protein
MTDQFIEGCAAKTTARNQHGNGLEKIRLAGPIGAGEDDGARIDIHPEVGIVAKVLESQPPDGEHVGRSMHRRYIVVAEPVFSTAERVQTRIGMRT